MNRPESLPGAAGDNILNPKTVASPLFGCRLTDPTPDAHAEFKSTVSCPAQAPGH